jgi:hypothetical protein
MRHLTVLVEAQHEARATDLALGADAGWITRSDTQRIVTDGVRDIVTLDIMLPAPKARSLLDGLSRLPAGEWSVVSVHPRSVFTGRPLGIETRPFPVPGLEIEEDLWEFAHVTISMILRVLLGAALVAHGMVVGNLPLMLAGLLFLPYHHSLIAIALGAVRGRGRLAGQSLCVFLLSTVLIAIAGAAVAFVEGGSVQWEPAGGTVPGLVIGAIVGTAAALASSDDSGRRELIGLAATAHLSVNPALVGIALMSSRTGGLSAHVVDFVLAVAALTLAAGLTLLATGAAKGVPSIRP